MALDYPAVAFRFHVVIDGISIGHWQKCDGIGMEVTVEEREEGGNNFFTHKLPTRIKYTNVKLTRYTDSDSPKIGTWLASLAHGVKRTTATITTEDTTGKNRGAWQLTGVVPIRYTGPSFDSSGSGPATESLELAHHGFLDMSGYHE